MCVLEWGGGDKKTLYYHLRRVHSPSFHIYYAFLFLQMCIDVCIYICICLVVHLRVDRLIRMTTRLSVHTFVRVKTRKYTFVR